MTMPIHGWCGKILFVDVSNGEQTTRETMPYARDYLGGRGIATRIYWERVAAGVNAFDPANHLIFMTGPLGATGAQGAARFVVAGKSPMRRPEGFCYGNLGGYFGPHLKRAGFDGIVVTGASAKPVYLFIQDGRAELRDAADLWGQGVYAVAEGLKARHGRQVRYVTTGVAGENRCRSATLMTDNEGSATGGFGAVMGAKRIKAIAVQGTGHPRVADPDGLQALNREVVRLNQRDPLFLPFPPAQVRRTGKASCYQCGLDCLMRNTLQTASGKTLVRKCQAMFVYFPWVMGRPGEPAETALAATGICNDLSLCTMEMYNILQWLDTCRRAGSDIILRTGLDCLMRNTLQTASGKTLVRKCQAMFVYFPWVMGRPGEPAETALAATGICNDLSLCTMEMYNILQWLDTCRRAGSDIIPRTGLDLSALGSLAFFEKLAHMIARREGFGDLLAEGLLRVGDALGDAATRHFASEVSGVGDGATYSAREYPMNGLLYAFEPRQPIAMLHEASRLVGFWVMHRNDPRSSPVDSDVFRAAAARFWGHPQAWDLTTHEGKAQAAVQIMDRTLVKDSLLLCDSAWPLMVSWHTPDRVGDASLEGRIFSAVTGIPTDEAGLKQYGARIFNLQRAVMLREGRRPKRDDVLADFNYTEPVQSVFMNPEVIVPGPGDAVVHKKGATLDPQAFDAMRDEFYRLRGWDAASGRQRQATLSDLGLGDVSGAIEVVEA